MRLLSIFSLIVFSLFVLMIHGQKYQPNRNGNPIPHPAVDGSTSKCQKACTAACPANCNPGTLCNNPKPAFHYIKQRCLTCLCPEPWNK